MNNCAEYMDLISAHADGELSESENRRLIEHISACKSCSALLDIYREISTAVDESAVPAPVSLRAGVMDRVLGGGAAPASGGETPTPGYAAPTPGIAAPTSGGAAPTPGGAKSRAPFRPVLLRYAPLAACLAIALLAVPWIANMLIQPRSDVSGPALTESVMSKSAQTDTGGADMGSYELPFEACDDSLFMAGTGEVEAPAPPPEAPLPEAAADDSQRSWGDSNEGGNFTVAGIEAPMDAPDVASDPWEAAPEEPMQQADMPGGDMEEMYSGGSTPLLESEGDDGSSRAFDPFDTAGGVMDLLGGFSDAYAWIEITGKLPKLLDAYDPEPLDGWLNWEMYYEISVDAAKMLIKEISGSESAAVIYNNDSGKYAIVLYSPGE